MTVAFGKLTECFRFVCMTVEEDEHRGRCHAADRENDKSLQYFSSLTIWNAADFVSGSKNCHIFSELLRKAGTGEDSLIYI